MDVNARRGAWWAAALAGLPHLLYGLVWYGPLWFYDLKTFGLAMLAHPAGLFPRYDLAPVTWARPAFWALTAGLGLLGVLRSRRASGTAANDDRRWSASWIGYALVGLLDWAVNVDPNLSVISAALLLGWLVLMAATLVALGRRDPLAGLLAVLPLAPMAGWSLGMDTLISNLEGFVYVPAAAVIAAVAVFTVRRGRFWDGLAASLAAVLLGGLPINIGLAYFPSPSFPAPATPGAVAGGVLGDLFAFTLAGLPLWAGLIWRRAARRRTAL